MEDFEKAYKAAMEFAKKDKHTLVVATADHSTGGFSIGAKGIYNWYGEPIKAAKRTPDFMADAIVKGADVEKTLKQYINQNVVKLTDGEIKTVTEAAKSKNVTNVDNAIEAIFDNRTNTAWTTGDIRVKMFRSTHTGHIKNVLLGKSITRIKPKSFLSY